MFKSTLGKPERVRSNPSFKPASMKLKMHGTTISPVEVTNIFRHGFWVFLGDEELLLSHEQFPWFKQATVEQITNAERPTPHRLYWPSLDVDLSVNSIRKPQDFPLMSRA